MGEFAEVTTFGETPARYLGSARWRGSMVFLLPKANILANTNKRTFTRSTVRFNIVHDQTCVY